MKVLIDTNVVLGVALQRQPYVEASAGVMFLSQTKRLDGYVSASAISDIYYIMRKHVGHSAAIDFMRRLVLGCRIAEVNQSIIELALASDFKDFEDAIQNTTASANALDAVVTRNVKDFKKSDLQILMPEQLLKLLSDRS